MDYKLAKQLKNAGFHQGGQGKIFTSDGKEWPTIIGSEKQLEDFVYFPTLSELIEVMPMRIKNLSVNDAHFVLRKLVGNPASYVAYYECEMTDKRVLEFNGKTPEESVAKLWLKLNNKK